MKNHLRFLFSAFMLSLFISGCGQSGALYLPKDEPASQTQTR